MFVRRENTFADTMYIYDIVNIICKISRCNFKYYRCAACIYMHVYINACVCVRYVYASDQPTYWVPLRTAHDAISKMNTIAQFADINRSEYARPIAWPVVSKCTYGQICDSNFCVLIAENNFLLTVPTPLSTMNISHSLITIPEASINGILINANNANPSGAIIKLAISKTSFS